MPEEHLVPCGHERFAKVNAIYKRFFKQEYPARTCIAVKELPKGAKVEIESLLFKSR